MVPKQNVRGYEGKKKMTPYEQGRLAFRKGQITNPYHHDNNFTEHRKWQLGFNQAYFYNLERVLEQEAIKS